MVHPVTYINKVIVYGKTYLKLVNPISSKILYGYPMFKKYLKETNAEIVVVETSKIVNIIAISLDNG